MIAFCVCVCRQACAAPWVALRDQRRVARQRRDALRSLLLNAARLGALPFGETRVLLPCSVSGSPSGGSGCSSATAQAWMRAPPPLRMGAPSMSVQTQ